MKKEKPKIFDELIRGVQKFLVTVYKESDRGAVLVASEYLNNILHETIKSKLEENDEKIAKELLVDMRILSDFGAKIKIAYGFGLIDKRMFEILEIIKDIRNVFAHSHEELNLKSVKFVSSLKKLKEYFKNEKVREISSISSKEKEIFIDCVFKTCIGLFVKESSLRVSRKVSEARISKMRSMFYEKRDAELL